MGAEVRLRVLGRWAGWREMSVAVSSLVLGTGRPIEALIEARGIATRRSACNVHEPEARTGSLFGMWCT